MQKRLTEQGLRFLEEGQFDKAGQILSLLINSFPDNADAHHMLGIIELERGNFDAAFILVHTAIDIEQNNPMFYNTLGNIELHRKNIAQAEQAFLHAVDYAPEKIEYKYNLAHFYLTQSQYHKAIDNYYAILRENPTHYLSIRGITLSYLLAGENAIALEHANSWVEEFTDCDEAYYYQGLCLYALNDITAALKAYDQGLSLAPNNYEIITAIGSCYRALGNFSIAETYLHKSLALQTNNPTAICQLAGIKLDTGDLDNARELFSNAINLDRSYIEPLCGLGKIELRNNNEQKALEYFYNAQTLEPNNIKCKMLIATTLLRMKNFVHGWEFYSQALNQAPFIKNIPSWGGEKLTKDQNLLVWTLENQNIAQQIMFAGMLSTLYAKAESVIVLCNSALIKLFEKSFPKYTFVSVLPCNTSIHQQIALDCLGKFFPFTTKAYLHADPERVKYYREKYKKLHGHKKLIGISWKTVISDKIIDHQKSIHLSELQQLLLNSNVQYISLQHEESSIPYIYVDLDAINNDQDLYEFAAQISAMDAVVSVDNYVAHLSGALGLNVYTILPTYSEWYWFKSEQQSFWYPNMHLLHKIGNLSFPT